MRALSEFLLSRPNETEELDRAPFCLLGILGDNAGTMTGSLGAYIRGCL